MTFLRLHISLFFVLMLSFLQGFAQADKYAGTITSSDLKGHLFQIASPEMKGRETATEGQRAAAAYIEGKFKEYGLQPGWEGGYQQQFPVLRDSLVKASLNINGRELEFDNEFYVTSNSGFNITFESGEIVFAGAGRSDTSSDDYKNINAKGKVVVVWPRAADYYSLQKAAKKNGAEALLIVQSRFSKGNAPREARMYIRDYRQDSLPNTFVISDKMLPVIFRDSLAGIDRAMKAGTNVSKSYPVPVKLGHAKIVEHLQSSNVIGIMEGTDKRQQAVVLTAHYDHLGAKDSVIYYGADDDGSGTVTVLEIAQAFSLAAKDGLKPRRTIVFMTVSGEEKGLWGSAYYADHPAVPLDSTSANVNIDMIGRIEKGRKADSLNYIYVVGDNRLSSDLRPISETLNNKYHKLHFDYKYNSPDDPERIYYRSDHYNFAKKGVPAIFYFSGLHEDYHRPTDTPDKIRYDLLSRRAQNIFYTTWEIANREEMLKRDLP